MKNYIVAAVYYLHTYGKTLLKEIGICILVVIGTLFILAMPELLVNLILGK